MRWLTLVVALAVGIGIGAGIMLSAQRVQARQIGLTVDDSSIRLLTIPAPRGHSRTAGPYRQRTLVQAGPSPVFLQDNKNEACWLASLGDRGEVIALAVAPPSSCAD
jgi:hypothetical protein